MILRKVRRLAACLAALAVIGLAPARSSADVTILVQELDSGGNVVASNSGTFAGSSALSFNGQYFTGFALVSTNSGTTSPVASLTPSFNGQLTSAFDVSENHTLKITVTDNGFVPNGPVGNLTVEVSGSNGFATGTGAVEADTRLFDPVTNTTIASRPDLFSPDGTKATDENIAVNGLTNPYAIQQVLTLSFSGNIPANGTFAATGGADLSSQPVPAPGGLALALIGLPLLGLRRVLRKRAEA